MLADLLTPHTFFFMALMSLFVSILWVDLTQKRIPNVSVLLLLLLGGIYVFFLEGPLLEGLLSMSLLGATFWLLREIFRVWKKQEALGLGDVKLAFVLGLWVPLEDLWLYLLLSGIFGMLFGLGWRIFKKERYFPFAPALILPLCILYLWDGFDFLPLHEKEKPQINQVRRITNMSLEGPMVLPRSGKPKQVVLLLHGYGADGDDLIGFSAEWRDQLPDAVFISPHAPFPCGEAMGFGREWFFLGDWSPETVLAGVQRVTPILNLFIDEVLEKWDLREENLAIAGFSQGAMVALYTALRRSQPCACVLSYSGAFIEDLESPVLSRPKVLLYHGDHDEVVPFEHLNEAEIKLRDLGVEVTSHVAKKMGHGIDGRGTELGGAFLEKCFEKEEKITEKTTTHKK